MSKTPTELTPLIEELLSIVQTTCQPSNGDWQTKFIEQIEKSFYQDIKDESGLPITADSECKKNMRLLAVERSASRKRKVPAAAIHNFK